MSLTEKVERMILSALESMEVTSANPTHINKLIQVNNIERLDLDDELNDSQKSTVKQNPEIKKLKDRISSLESTGGAGGKSTDLKKLKTKLSLLEGGNVGEIAKMGSKQFGNVKSLALNPAQFLIAAIAGKIGKAAKGGIPLLIAAIAIEVATLIKDEFFKPGRLFDVRFREAIDKQIILFLARKEQQELKQGFRQVITSTNGGLRGVTLAGQIGGNFYNPDRITPNFIDNRMVSPDNIISQDARALSGRGLNSNRFGNGRFG